TTLLSMSNIKRHCDDAGARCVFVIIPTKESVYFPLLDERTLAAHGQRLSRLVVREDAIRARLIAHAETLGAPHVDVLPLLREAARSSDRLLYPTHDSHPYGEGYRVIAAAIAPTLGAR